MGKIIIPLIILFLIQTGCSSNEIIIADNRREINNAIKWDPDFIPNDTSSGIKLEFVSQKIDSGKVFFAFISPNSRHKLGYSNIKLWTYPIDTIVHIQKKYDCPEPMPSSRIVDYTNIYYEIKNKPIEINSELSPDKATFFMIPEGTYLMQWESSGYVTKWIKDLIIKPNCWSVTKIDTVYIPIVIH